MIQLKERPVEHPEEREERCASCGEIGTADSPLEWENADARGDSRDLYCQRCYQGFRTHYEEAQEALIASLKHFRLHEVYSVEHLQEAIADLGTSEEEAFAEYLRTGSAAFCRPRKRD